MTKLKASEIIEIDDKFIDRVAERIKANHSVSPTHYDTNEVAKLLKVGRQSVTRYIHSYNEPGKYPNTPKLKATKAGRGWLIKKSDLDKFLNNPKNPEY